MNGVVLAGGKSTRMGTDKRSIVLPNGLSMQQNAVSILKSSRCSKIFVSGSGALMDIHPGMGPLGGIEASLTKLSGSFVMFLPCDMPFVLPSQIDSVISAFLRTPHLPAVAMAPFMEPLFTAVPLCWKTRVANAIKLRHLKVGKLWMDCGFTPVRIPDGNLLKDTDYPYEIPC